VARSTNGANPLVLAARLVRVGAVLTRHAVAGGAQALAAKARRDHDRAAAVWPGRAPVVLGELGAAFTKAGQLLATRRDVLAPRWCTALGSLHDDVPLPRRGTTAAVVRAAHGDAWPYAEFDEEPVAAGSIAVVHRAVLTDGREVAVKVRRPGVARALGADMTIMRAGSGLIAGLPAFRGIPVVEVVDQLCTAVSGQVDFAAERAALARLRANLADLPFIRLPAPVDELCGPEVLVMEYVPDLARFGRADVDADRAAEIVTNTLTAVYTMLFRDGFVHCDLHPGNLYLGQDGRIVLLDAGFTVLLDDRVRGLFSGFFLNMAAGRGEVCAELVLRSARAVPADADLTGFRTALAELVTEVSGVPAAEFDLAGFSVRLFDLQRRFGVCAAPEFIFPLLSLLVIEGMVDEFSADVDFQAVAAPILLAGLSSAAAPIASEYITDLA
jgi:ubiquinone biosynthesis protein